MTDHCKDLAQKAAEYAGILAVQYSTHILGKMQPIIMENLSNMLSESSTKSVETSTPGHMVIFTKAGTKFSTGTAVCSHMHGTAVCADPEKEGQKGQPDVEMLNFGEHGHNGAAAALASAFTAVFQAGRSSQWGNPFEDSPPFVCFTLFPPFSLERGWTCYIPERE